MGRWVRLGEGRGMFVRVWGGSHGGVGGVEGLGGGDLLGFSHAVTSSPC